MDRIFENTHVRRLFFISFGLILGVCVMLRLLLAGVPSKTTVGELVDKFAMSLSVTVALGGFLFYVTPKYQKSRQLELVPPTDLRGIFKAQIDRSRFWIFTGATGRYVRSQVIPRFVERASQQRKPLTISLVLLDVSDEDACREYAQYRNGTESENKQWDSARVRMEVCATVLVAIAARTAFLRINLGFAASFSTFRVDISDEQVILTKEDPRSSAVVCDYTNEYYDYFVLDARLAESQARREVVPSAGFDLASGNKEGVRELLLSVNLLHVEDDDEFLEAVLRAARERRNPYPG